jgi:NADH:ubiquinone oxidoreductase subunit C
MTNEELITELTFIQPNLLPEAGGEWPNFFVEASDWPKLAQALRFKDDLFFDYLFCLTCVDWKTHLTVVYHLSSTRYRHNIVIKSKLNREKPEIQTVCDIWRTAEFHEREVFELFGVNFLHHPDLRKLILPDDWVGFPLRKDYEDPINMIKL